MKNKITKISLFILFLISVNYATSMLYAETKADIHTIRDHMVSRIKKYTLDNGLRIILMKNGTTPTVAAYLKLGVGSANEPFGQAGTAHFLEHLLFKGTHSLGTLNYEKEKLYLDQIFADGEKIDSINRKLADPLLNSAKREQLKAYKKKIEQRMQFLQKNHRRFVLSEEDSTVYTIAGQVGYNAYTSADVTNYQIKLPKNRLELWAYIESERFLHPVLREFYKEREVIQEERRMRYDSKPASLLYELYLKTAYGMSPYGKPVIGFSSNMPRLRYTETRDFFERHYIPSRMVITIVGDIDFEETFRLLNKYFSRLPAKQEPEFPPIEYEPSPGRKTAELVADHSPYLITGWSKPGLGHKHNNAFEVTAKLLAGGNSSRLYKRLVIEEKISPYVYAYNGNPGEKLHNQFTVFAGMFKHEDYDKALKIINEEIEDLAKNGPTQKELDRVKNRFLASLVDSLKAKAGLANQLSWYEVMYHDYRVLFDDLEAIEKLKPEDISDAVKTWCIRKNNTTVKLVKP